MIMNEIIVLTKKDGPVVRVGYPGTDGIINKNGNNLIWIKPLKIKVIQIKAIFK